MPIIGTIASSTRQGLSTNSYDAIATANVNGSSTITFSNISQAYRHLQIRMGAVMPSGATLRLTFNNDTAGNYNYSKISHNGTGYETNTNTSANSITFFTQQGGRSSYMNQLVVDIHDYASTTRFKGVRSILGGVGVGNPPSSSSVEFNSGVYNGSLSAISIITLTLSTSVWDQGFISLYGIKG